MLYRREAFADPSAGAEADARPSSRSPLDLAVQALKAHFKALALWIGFCLGVTLAYIMVTPAEFAATSSILLEPRRPAILTQSDVNQIQQSLDTPQIESQTQVIKSSRLLNRVIKELDLVNDPELSTPPRGVIARLRALLSDEDGRPPSLPAEAFAQRVNVRRLGTSLVLEISVAAASPEKSARLTNAVLAAYIYDQVTSKLLDMRRTGDWLQSRLDDLRTQQEAALTAMRNDFTPDTAFPAADIRVLNTATPQARKSFPNTTLITLFAFSLALFTGVGGIVVRRLMDSRVWTEDDLSELNRTRHLASVPKIRISEAWFSNRQPIPLNFATQQPNTDFAESFRTLRNAILIQSESAPRSIGLVSWNPQAGSTLLAANLAHTLAASGAPVVLLDADLHNSALTRMMTKGDKMGVAEVLIGGNKPDLVVLNASLGFLPASGAGGRVPPFLVLGSPAMRELLEQLTQSYIVVVDLPPLTQSNDAVSMAALLDAIIVVVESGSTRITDVADMIRDLTNGSGAIIGTVLNKTLPT